MTKVWNPPHLLVLFSRLVSPAFGLVGKCLFVLLSLNEIYVTRDYIICFLTLLSCYIHLHMVCYVSVNKLTLVLHHLLFVPRVTVLTLKCHGISGAVMTR